MRVVWVAIPTEVEWDVWRCQQDHSDLEVVQYSLTGLEGQRPPDVEFWQHAPRGPLGHDTGAEVLGRIAAEAADLYVFRYPLWIAHFELEQLFHQLFDALPAVAWMSEQGPTLSDAYVTCAAFRRVAVNHGADLARYGRRFPDKRLFLLPFGTPRWGPDDLRRLPEYESDFVADGGCHYGCWEHGGWKRTSVDVMVRPLLDAGEQVALWGAGASKCGWLDVPGSAAYRGEYTPEHARLVYVSTKVYLGISWNWATSGYGCKLARALGAGVCVLWHRTPGMVLDGLEEGRELVCSSSPAETLHWARQLKYDDGLREELGRAGRAFAEREWEWGANLKRLVKEVHA